MKILSSALYAAATQALTITPNTSGFGAIISDLQVSDLNLVHDKQPTTSLKSLGAELKAALHRWKFLSFPNQGRVSQSEQLAFIQLLGEAYNESSHINRIHYINELDPRVAIISNDKDFGLTNVGVEGFHSDGNVVRIPHAATLLYCEKSIPGGDTLLVELDAVLAKIPPSLKIQEVNFASAHVENLEHPLAYPHPSTGKPTMFFGLGELSGIYSRNGVKISQAETNTIKYFIEKAIEEVGVYTHKWNSGDMLMLDNLAIAHRASDGTQAGVEDVGLRVLRRVTLAGRQELKRRGNLNDRELYPRACNENKCLVSLSGVSGFESGSGHFVGVAASAELCRYHLNENAVLASLRTLEDAELAKEIVGEVGKPHWINGVKEGTSVREIEWGGVVGDEWEGDYPWDEVSGQPNDCDGVDTEPCIFVGPEGKWFDFACDRKTEEGTTPGPEMTWGGGRRMYNIHSLCEVDRSKIDPLEWPNDNKMKMGNGDEL